MWFLSSGVATLVQLGLLWEGEGGVRARRGYGRSGGRQGRSGHLDWWLVQVLEADALDVASIGRAVTAGAEVWRGGVPGGTEATGGRHQAADRGAGSLMLHPESWFYHRRAGPAR